VLLAPPDAPEDPAAIPDAARLAAFRITGGQALKLHRGTWHAGPYFEAPQAEFLNLELSDTNEADHHTVGLPKPVLLTP
jgi:ureidoglycolate hydrolase